MVLNHYLKCSLGVIFKDKYNELAVKEIVENPEKYPNIAWRLDEVIACYNGLDKKNKYNSRFFDCDDQPYATAGFNETMELYRAFINAFIKERKSFKLSSASFGKIYLSIPDVTAILDTYNNVVGQTYLRLLPNQSEMSKEFFNHGVSGGITSTSKLTYSFPANNANALKCLGNEFEDLCKTGNLLSNGLDNSRFNSSPDYWENGKTGYPIDCYEFRIGRNLIRIFTNERGFDAFCLVRSAFSNALTPEQKDNEIIKNIGLY